MKILTCSELTHLSYTKVLAWHTANTFYFFFD